MTTPDAHDLDPARRRRPALIVTGMHRSGTSAMARVLSLVGAALPERVIQPGPDNPLGFWEPSEMVALSDEVLAEVGSAWDDVFVHQAGPRAWDQREAFLTRAEAVIVQNYGDRDLPVIKDPRSSVLSRLWHQALVNCGRSPVYVIMVRHPREVAGSLNARDGFPLQKGMLVWAAYMLAVERATRDHSRVFVSYAGMLEDPQAVLDRIEQALGLPLPRRDSAGAGIESFLSRTHRHHRADPQLASDADDAVVRQVHDWMQAASAGVEPDPAAMDAAGEAMDSLARTWAPIFDHLNQTSADRLRQANLALADSEARLLRERARVNEVITAEALQRATLGSALQASTDRADTAAAEAIEQCAMLRDLRLEITALKSGISRLLSDNSALTAEMAELERGSVPIADLQERVAEIAVLQGRLGEIAELQGQLERSAEEAARLRQRNATLQSSLSWKLTRPVRVVQSRLKRRD